jgi:uncharacterized membrane protein YiaA
MRKRRLAVTLILVGLMFVGLLHTALAYAFGTGLEQFGLLGAGLCLFGILFVNFGLPAPADEGSDE